MWASEIHTPYSSRWDRPPCNYGNGCRSKGCSPVPEDRSLLLWIHWRLDPSASLVPRSIVTLPVLFRQTAQAKVLKFRTFQNPLPFCHRWWARSSVQDRVRTGQSWCRHSGEPEIHRYGRRGECPCLPEILFCPFGLPWGVPQSGSLLLLFPRLPGHSLSPRMFQGSRRQS